MPFGLFQVFAHFFVLATGSICVAYVNVRTAGPDWNANSRCERVTMIRAGPTVRV